VAGMEETMLGYGDCGRLKSISSPRGGRGKRERKKEKRVRS